MRDVLRKASSLDAYSVVSFNGASYRVVDSTRTGDQIILFIRNDQGEQFSVLLEHDDLVEITVTISAVKK